MDPGTTEGYRMMESGADAWAVEGDARRGLPESREIGAEYEAMATSTAPVNPSGSKTAEGKAARHTAFDPPNEVSPGVLSDGRWTGEHPLVRGYINEVTSQHGSSLNPDLLVASTLPFDLRIYALVALSVQDMAESPVFWLLYNANQKDRTRAVIQDQIQKRRISAPFFEDGWDTRVVDLHKNFGHLVPDDRWLLEQARQKAKETPQAANTKRKLQEIEESRGEAGAGTDGDAPASGTKKRRRRAPKITMPKKRKTVTKTEPPSVAPAPNDRNTEDDAPADDNEAAHAPMVKSTKASTRTTREPTKPTRVSARVQAKQALVAVTQDGDKPAGPSTALADMEALALLAGFADAAVVFPKVVSDSESVERTKALPQDREPQTGRSAKARVTQPRERKAKSAVKTDAEEVEGQTKESPEVKGPGQDIRPPVSVDEEQMVAANALFELTSKPSQYAAPDSMIGLHTQRSVAKDVAVLPPLTDDSEADGPVEAQPKDGEDQAKRSSVPRVRLLVSSTEASAPKTDAKKAKRQVKPALPKTRARKGRKSDENREALILSSGATKKGLVLEPSDNDGPVPVPQSTVEEEEEKEPSSELQTVPAKPQHAAQALKRQSKKKAATEKSK